MTMTKDEQVRVVAEQAGISLKQAHVALDAVVAVVVAGLVMHERVVVHGLGSFEKRRRSPRRVRNPATGVMMDVPAKIVVTFKPSSHLRDRVARGS